MKDDRRLGTVSGIIVPQWPVVFEGELDNPSAVLKSLREVGKTVRQNKVDTVIVLSPFWIARSGFYVEPSAFHSAQNDFSGYPVDLRYNCPGDPALAQQLIEAGKKDGLPVQACHHWADVAAAVPLKVLFPNGEKPIVPLSSSELSLETCLKWGSVIRQAIEKSGKNVLILGGGGLSHNLTACLHLEDGMAAVIFDQKVLNCLRDGKGPEIKKMDPYWIRVGNPAADLSDLYVMLGVLGPTTRFALHAYDGAPGQGWAVLTT
ncbi:MAG: hypothetical protein JNK54_09300 [Elusimicrobia bacterium]|nr:hypothetical protein [Elusimicrobiota bacterium]